MGIKNPERSNLQCIIFAILAYIIDYMAFTALALAVIIVLLFVGMGANSLYAYDILPKFAQFAFINFTSSGDAINISIPELLNICSVMSIIFLIMKIVVVFAAKRLFNKTISLGLTQRLITAATAITLIFALIFLIDLATMPFTDGVNLNAFLDLILTGLLFYPVFYGIALLASIIYVFLDYWAGEIR